MSWAKHSSADASVGAVSLMRTRLSTMDVDLCVSRSADERLPLGQRGPPALFEGLAVHKNEMPFIVADSMQMGG